MMMFLLIFTIQSFDDIASLQAVAAHRPEDWALIQAFLSGQKTVTDLQVAALRRVTSKPLLPQQRDQPTLADVIIPEGILLDFYGGDRLCDGPRTPRPHAFAVPSYVSLTYRRLTYDAGPEGFGDESLGIKGEGVGVIYSGLVTRIWGHGFHIELETDPLNGVTQRIEMVHFAEESCGVGPASVPCLKVKGLFTFNWQVRDGTYQVRYAHRQWQDILQLANFYYPARYVMVAGTPCIELRGLGGIDAGYAEGRTRVWQTALPFYWSPCGDFLFSHFHRRTQHRMNPWPGHGLPLLAFTTTKPTEKQRVRTRADLEAARDTPTEIDLAAGVDPRYLGADRNDNFLDTAGFTKRATEEAVTRIQTLNNELTRLGGRFPGSHLASFAVFAARNIQHHRVMYIYDMHLEERILALRRKFPKWATDRVRHNPAQNFSHEVAVWKDIDWRPPWLAPRYRAVFDHPNQVIPVLRNLDDQLAEQGEMVAAITPTTDLIDHDTDPNEPIRWPTWDWPRIENPDTYWTVYFTWL